MLDFTRFSWYDYLRNGNLCGFLLRKFHISGIIDSTPAYEAPRAAAITVASIARSNRGYSFGTYNAETATIRLVGRVTVSNRIITMCLRQKALYHRRFAPVNTFLKNIPNLSQLNPTLESHPDGASPVGDSPVAYEVDLTLTRGGAFPPIPRSFLSLSSQSPVNPSAPVVSLSPGAGGLSGGGA